MNDLLPKLNNPFNLSSVEHLQINLRPNPTIFNKRAEASLWFSNGDTKGIQSFKADDPDTLYSNIHQFLNALQK